MSEKDEDRGIVYLIMCFLESLICGPLKMGLEVVGGIHSVPGA